MIKIIKLSSGEELIGDVSESGTKVRIKNPCMLQMVPSRNGNEPAMGMFPYAMYTKEHTINIESSNLIWQEEPVQELYNQYNSVFGSGIQLAQGIRM